MMPMIVAEILCLPIEDVRCVTGDTESVGYTDGTFGSRTTIATGHATYKAAQEAVRMMTERAARVWDIKPEDVEWADAVEFPDLNAAFKQGISPQEISKEAAAIVGHQCGLRFGAQEGDLTKDEEEYLALVSDYLVCRFKAESMVSQVRLRLDEATGMADALESEVADLKAKLQVITDRRGEINDEMSDAEVGNLIDKTIGPCKTALDDAGLKVGDVANH